MGDKNFGLKAFKETDLGRRINMVLGDNEHKMLTLTEHDMPAAQAVGKTIMAAVPEDQLTDYVKQMIGRCIKERMAAHRLFPFRKGRVAAGNLFNWGTVYREANDG